jgi:hypothetical protein
MLVNKQTPINSVIQNLLVCPIILLIFFSDVWGPTLDSTGRYKYYVSFIDDFNKFIWIYLLKNRSEVFSKVS